MFDLIFDRDGILNIDVGYTYRIEDFTLPDSAVAALCLLRDVGGRFSIATGQSGIARGKFSEADMHKFNQHLLKQYATHGISFAVVAFCPHYPAITGDCECRKPKVGMLRQIEAQIGPIAWKQAWGIGDKPFDAEMMLTIGGQSVLVRSEPHNNRAREVYWKDTDPMLTDLLSNPRNFVANSLWDAATIITSKVIS